MQRSVKKSLKILLNLDECEEEAKIQLQLKTKSENNVLPLLYHLTAEA